MNDNENKNRRILIIDDNEAIHKDFRAILEDGNSDSANIDAEKSVLFGETEVSPKKLTFEIDSAFQGEEGLEKKSDRLYWKAGLMRWLLSMFVCPPAGMV